MLNRRLLRVKAMQSVYAAIQAERASYEAAKDLIFATFAQDLNSMEPYNVSLSEGSRKLANLLFEENYKSGKVIIKEPTPSNITAAAQKGVLYYTSQLQEDRDRIRKRMILEAEGVFGLYLKILGLLIQLSESVEETAHEKQNRKYNPEQTPVYELKFTRSPYILALRENKALADAITRHNAGWEDKEAFVRQHFRDNVIKDPIFEAYTQTGEADAAEEQKVIRHLIKNLIFKNELIAGYFEENDLYWAENSEIVQSMVLKTMKNIEESGGSFILLALSSDWDDDRRFFEQLYRQTIANAVEYEELITLKSKNWDSTRLALTDKIIIMMALAEMTGFPNIPTKVTINEYIEMSKIYSTPQSKQYVNGLLDALSEHLLKEGKIKKSGRGLIDNK